MARRLAFVGTFGLAALSVFGLGSDYPDHQLVIGAPMALGARGWLRYLWRCHRLV